MRKSVLFLLAVLVLTVLVAVMLSTPNGPVDADAPRAGAPSAIQSSPSSTELLLFGGEVQSPAEGVLGDTWHYDGVDWNLVPINGSGPPPRSRSELVYDSKRNRMVLFGGRDESQYFNDTWEYVGGVWNELLPASAPSPRAGSDMVYDSNRDVVVLFGGYDGPWDYCATSANTETWEYDGATWQQIHTVQAPPKFISGDMVYDEAREKVVLYTGWECQMFGWQNQTWEYDGSDWVRTTMGPLGDIWRYAFTMAYDSRRQRTVLFGGFHHGGSGCSLDDTWEYDGAQWAQVVTANTPPGRCGQSMSYDPIRGRVMMFGGYPDGVLVADLWEYDGATWQQVSTASQPPVRKFAALAPSPHAEPCGPETWTHLVTQAEGAPTDPAWARDGSYLVYMVWLGWHREIWGVNADGTNPHPIITDEVIIEWPDLSPDGQKLALSRYEGESAHRLVVADADGSNRNEIVSFGNSIHPRWSPDGSVILFSHGPAVNDADLYTIRPDGSEMTQISSLSCEIRQASWSPDGRRIVFAWNGDYGCARDRWDIYTIGVDGSDLRKLTRDGELGEAHNGNPEWSPGGRWIVFTSWRGGNVTHLWIMESDGTNQRQLTTSERETHGTWSPDGRYLAFHAQVNSVDSLYLLDMESCPSLPVPPTPYEDKLLVIGGNDSSGALSLVEVYDPATDSWSTASPMPAPKYTASAVVIDGYVYVLGGDNRLFRYDPPTDSWGELASIPTTDVHQLWKATGVVNRKIYASPGHSWMYMYDPASDSWSPRTAVPWERSIEGFASLNGKLYAIGGGEPGHVPGEIDRIDVYDPATDSWTHGGAATMPGQRTHLPGVIPLLDGKIYVAGGWNGYSAQSTVFVYDPATDAWASEANMPTARWRLAYGPSGGKLYVMGGNYGGAGGNWQDVNEELTPGALPPPGVWASRAPMPTARDGMAIAVVPGAAPCGPESWQYLVGHSDGSAASPTWSKDGSKLVYFVWFGWHREIWGVNADGTNRHPIITDEDVVEWPELSPDGQKLVYARYVGQHRIVVADPDGSNRTEIVSTGDSVHPRWSPDGSRILITHGTTYEKEAYTVKPDGSDMTQITSLGGELRQASWSPDGTQIAFGWNGEYGGARDRWDIYAINVDGTNLRKLTHEAETGPGSCGSPEWSPDGQWITYNTRPATGEPLHVWIMRSDGSEHRQLISGDRSEQAIWSPDGRYLAFRGNEQDLYLLDLTECPGWEVPSLAISRIEINQAIQDETNSIPLVADKRTVVRVHVRATGDEPVQNVTGQLHVLQNGSPIHTLSPQLGMIEARPATMPYSDAEILNGHDALNFYVDGLPAGTYAFSATVGISPSVDDAASRVITGEFTSTRPIRILYCNVKQDSALPSQDSLSGYYDDYFSRVYPIPRSDSIEREYEYEGSIENLASCPMSEDHCQMALVADLWARLWWHNATSEPNADFAVGFVPSGTLGAAGVAISIIPTVIVEHDASHSGSTLAHEVAHYQDFDLGDEYAGGKFNCEINPPASHVTSTHPPNSCPDSTQLGDESGTFINAQQNKGAFDVYEGSAKWVPDLPFAPVHRSFMGIGTNANSWVAENVYRRLFKVLSPGPEMVEQQALTPTRYVLLSGIISQADEADLEPFYVYSDTTAPDAPLPGPYSAEVQDAGGSPLATQPFTVSFALLGSQVEDADAAPFLFAMPYPEGSRRVVLKHGSTVLANVAASDNPPTVTVTSPAGGESWSGVHDVQWAAGDLDGDPLTYTLLYTSDGTDWLALATNVTETTYALDTSTVAGGSECHVEVWASDGINTSTARSNPFSVARKAPHTTIISPPSGTEVHPTDALALNGVGYDFEDGQLSGAALAWTCDAVGSLGSGSPLFVDWLPVGTHAITLTVTDSDLMTGTASITLTMLNEAPSLDTVAPLSGTGEVSSTTFFTSTWTDPNGWQDLKQCWFHIGASPALAGNVTLLYNTVKDKLWLRSDDGTAWTGGYAPRSVNVLENSQAIVHCDLTTVQGLGDTLSVTWAIEFKPGYTGTKKLGLKCKDRSKAKAKGEWKGTWTIE